MADLKLTSIKPWAPHPMAAPVVERSGDTLSIAPNGTRTCVGGWQLDFSDVVAGEAYSVCWEVEPVVVVWSESCYDDCSSSVLFCDLIILYYFFY